MAIGAMTALNIASNVSSIAGNAGGAGGASASSGQGGAGIGFNLLGAPGDPAGVLTNLITNRKIRKEDKRRFDLEYDLKAPLLKAQTEQLDLANQEEERKQQWNSDLRRYLYGGRV